MSKILYQDIIIRDLASKYKKDPRVISEIVYSPLKFLKRVMTDNNDTRPIRIQYFGSFVQKHNFNKDTRVNRYIKDIEENLTTTSIVMSALLHFNIKDVNSAKRIIDEAKETKDFDKIKMIWDALQEYNK